MSAGRVLTLAEIVASTTEIMKAAYADLVRRGLADDWDELAKVYLIPLRLAAGLYEQGQATPATLREIAEGALRGCSVIRKGVESIEQEAASVIALAEAATTKEIN